MDIRKTLIAFILLSPLLSCKTTRSGGSSLRSEELGPETSPAPVAVKTLTIEAPFRSLIYTRKQELYDLEAEKFKDPYVDAKIQVGDQSFPASLRLRGGVSYCGGFPQLKLKLPKDHPLEGQTEFKVKTHGTYALDPSIPLDIPNCGNEVGVEDHRERFAADNELYDLSAVLLDYHLKNWKYTVRYLDESIKY